MELHDLKGHTMEDAVEGVAHDTVATSKNGSQLTPTGGHVHHLQRMDVLPLGGSPTVMHQVHLKVPRMLLIPGDATHRYLLARPVDGASFPAKQPRFILG